jgi:glycosyltransferase involved in cell wall biosynthesis
MSKHIVIFEPEAGGHQMEYIRYLVADLRERIDARLTLLTTPHAARHKNCDRLAREFADSLTVRIIPEPSASHRGFRALGQFLEYQWQSAQMADASMRRIGWDHIDFVLLPHLESIGLLHLGLRRPAFGGKPWATIAVGTRFHHRACGIRGSWRWIDPVQGFFFRRVLSDPTLIRFGTIDPYLSGVARNPKVVYCPDPCPQPVLTESAHAREVYGLRLDAFVVLVFGVIDRRKCLDVLLEGALRVPADVNLSILVAGPQAKNDVGGILRGSAASELRRAGRLVEHDRFILSGRDIDPASAADAVWVYYEPNFVYSSSVLVRAALSGRPVIVRRRGVVGQQVVENGLGLALDSDAPEAVAAALTQLGRDKALRRRMGEAGIKTFAGHSPHAFARPITDGILSAVAPSSPP